MTTRRPPFFAKSLTGISGFDEITSGGLPRGRTTLVIGGPGFGKTVFVLQTLVNGARQHDEPGIFVAFEESAARIVANAGSFGWGLPALQRRKLHFLDAQLAPDLVQAGGFDLQGLLAALDAKVEQMGAKRIVFDALDVLLTMLGDPVAQRREVFRLHEWLLSRGLTALITAKSGTGDHEGTDAFSYLQFMVDCAVELKHKVVSGVSLRSLRVMKYRGSTFSENESPLVIGRHGLEVAGTRNLLSEVKVTAERVSSGIERLDTMLNGGYFRGACVLISGSPGTAKSTLGGAFAAAACARGERTLFVSFDSDPQEIVRNLTSVGIRLGKHLTSGLLRMELSRTTANNAEVHLLSIKAQIREHRARCLVIDPISALGRIGAEGPAHGCIERLVDWAKAENLTALCTSLLSHPDQQFEGIDVQISTIADTWIHLSYVVHAGERNRALTIIKSRGTAHSNQVRELVLSDQGVSLADVYTSGGQVMMGTLRWEKERAERLEQGRLRAETSHRRVEIEVAQSELQGQVKRLQRELELKQVDLDMLVQTERERQRARAEDDVDMRLMRSADRTGTKPTGPRPARPRRKALK